MDEMTSKKPILAFFLWAWVGAAMAAYLYQFAGIAGGVLAKLGIGG